MFESRIKLGPKHNRNGIIKSICNLEKKKKILKRGGSSGIACIVLNDASVRTPPSRASQFCPHPERAADPYAPVSGSLCPCVYRILHGDAIKTNVDRKGGRVTHPSTAPLNGAFRAATSPDPPFSSPFVRFISPHPAASCSHVPSTRAWVHLGVEEVRGDEGKH